MNTLSSPQESERKWLSQWLGQPSSVNKPPMKRGYLDESMQELAVKLSRIQPSGRPLPLSSQDLPLLP